MRSILFVTFYCIPFLLFSQLQISTNEIIGKQLPRGATSNPYKLRKEVYDAFLLMKGAALKDGIEIEIVSGFRSFGRQSAIWDRKFQKYQKQGFNKKESAQKIIEYSTYPGTSRHHWGTDMDIIQKVKNRPTQLLVAKNFENEGAFCELHQWMQKHSERFGFYLVYTKDISRTGFSYEPWHYTYKPTSKKILKRALKSDVYGFLLKEDQNPLDFNYFNTHILGINSLLKE